MIQNLFKKAEAFNKNIIQIEANRTNNTESLIQQTKKDLIQIKSRLTQSAKKFDMTFKRNQEAALESVAQ